jgi:MFS family permease
MTIALAIIRDLFEGQAARTKLSYVAIATTFVPLIAPTAGAALLALGGWRVIHAALAGIGLLLLLAILLGFVESARVDPANRLAPSVVARNYIRVLMPWVHPRQRRRFRSALRLCQRLLAVLDQCRGVDARTVWPSLRGNLPGYHGGWLYQQPA